MAIYIWVNIASGSYMLSDESDDTKPLPELMLTSH